MSEQHKNDTGSLFRFPLWTLLASLTNIAVVSALVFYFAAFFEFDLPDLVYCAPIVALYVGAAFFLARTPHTMPASLVASIVGFFSAALVSRVPISEIFMSDFPGILLAIPFYTVILGAPVVLASYFICESISKRIQKRPPSNSRKKRRAIAKKTQVIVPHPGLGECADQYFRNIKKASLDDAGLAALVDDAVILWEHGILNDREQLYRLLRIALYRIPDHQATQQLLEISRNKDEMEHVGTGCGHCPE